MNAGIATAARMPMMVTTTMSSINVKPDRSPRPARVAITHLLPSASAPATTNASTAIHEVQALVLVREVGHGPASETERPRNSGLLVRVVDQSANGSAIARIGPSTWRAYAFVYRG